MLCRLLLLLTIMQAPSLVDDAPEDASDALSLYALLNELACCCILFAITSIYRLFALISIAYCFLSPRLIERLKALSA